LGKSTSESSETKDGGDSSVKLDFGLSSSNLNEASKKAWPFDFGLIYSVSLSKEGLTTSMVVRNEGETAWDFQILMHSYLRIAVSRPSVSRELVYSGYLLTLAP
jgi:glucose-6-phosphate 1-epimerase